LITKTRQIQIHNRTGHDPEHCSLVVEGTGKRESCWNLTFRVETGKRQLTELAELKLALATGALANQTMSSNRHPEEQSPPGPVGVSVWPIIAEELLRVHPHQIPDATKTTIFVTTENARDIPLPSWVCFTHSSSTRSNSNILVQLSWWQSGLTLSTAPRPSTRVCGLLLTCNPTGI